MVIFNWAVVAVMALAILMNYIARRKRPESYNRLIQLGLISLCISMVFGNLSRMQFLEYRSIYNVFQIVFAVVSIILMTMSIAKRKAN